MDTKVTAGCRMAGVEALAVIRQPVVAIWHNVVGTDASREDQEISRGDVDYWRMRTGRTVSGVHSEDKCIEVLTTLTSAHLLTRGKKCHVFKTGWTFQA